MTKLEELGKDFNQINLDLKVIQQDVKKLEARIIVAEKINANTKWILRLIISVLFTGVLGVLARSLL
ncbi:hypothetical protein ACQKLM_29715 [Bacillus thuringiensis]|uniref:hypothetical protein n=1 Tax=Bacillus thuringiensis TaxID=1428 RepID=UPI003D008CD9